MALRDPSARVHRWAFALLAALLLGIAARGWDRALSERGNDLTIYLDAAAATLAGRNPFTVPDYLYLPFFAALLAPLELLPRPLGAGLWQLGSWACAVAGLRGAVRLVDPAGSRPWLGWVTLLLTFRLWDSNLSYGQANAFTFAAAVGALRFLAAGRDASAGGTVGLATAFKVLPGILALLLACRGRWRACGAALGTALAAGALLPLLWLGPGGAVAAHRAFFAQVAEPYLRGGEVLLAARPYLAGQSLLACAYRTFAATPVSAADPAARAALAQFDPDSVHWGVRLAVALHLALFAAAAVRGRSRVGSYAVAEAGALALCTALLCGPLVHKAHLCWSALAFAVLLSRVASATERGQWLRRALPVALAALLIGATTPLLFGTDLARAVVAGSGLFLGIECLWWALLVAHWRRA